MFNARGLALFLFLALIGMLTSLTEVNAGGFGRRSRGCGCPEVQACAPEVQGLQGSVRLLTFTPPAIKGYVYDINGTALVSPTQVTIDVYDDTPAPNGPVHLGTALSSTSTGYYAIQWIQNAVPLSSDSILVVTFRRNANLPPNLTILLSSIPQQTENLSPIIPR